MVNSTGTDGTTNYLCQAEVTERTGISAKRLRRFDNELGVVQWANRPAWPADRVTAFLAQREQERELIASTLSSHEVAERAGCCSNYVIKNFEPVAVVGAYRRFRYDPSIVDAVIERLAAGLQRQIEALQREVSAKLLMRTQVVPSSEGMPAVRDPKVRGLKPKQITKPKNRNALVAARRAEQIKTDAVEMIDRKTKTR